MNTIVNRIYKHHQKSIESLLVNKTTDLKLSRTSILQIPGIICNEESSNCKMYKLNLMPKANFARTTTCSALQLLTDIPYSKNGGEQLVTSLLWTQSFKEHFADGFVTMVYDENEFFKLNTSTKATLLIPVKKKVEQFSVELSLFKFGIVHAYINAITDLLNRPNLDIWDERYAGIIKFL